MCLTDIAIWENGKKALTMAEYINREAAIRALLNDAPEQVSYSREDAADCIRYMDAADAALVRHGRWFQTAKWWQGGSAWKQCSECGILHLGKSNFCPNCGAKMDLED